LISNKCYNFLSFLWRQQVYFHLFQFKTFLESHPDLNDYLNEQLPQSLASPESHLQRLENISKLLEDFTRVELNAGRFIHGANDWFASVSYTIVSSLGAAPEKFVDDKGAQSEKLTVSISPHGVIDPLLYVLAKSIKKPKLRPQPLPPPADTPILKIALLIVAALIVLFLSALVVGWWIAGPLPRVRTGSVSQHRKCVVDHW